MPKIFIDESGQFEANADNEMFVIGSFSVGNARRTQKAWRSQQSRKLPKQYRHRSEIKFSDIKDHQLRMKVLKGIADMDVRIRYVYLACPNIPTEYYRKDKVRSGLLYTHVIGETLNLYLPINDAEFRVFCDTRSLKGITHKEFQESLQARLLPALPTKSLVQIAMIDSVTNENIQIADWISGALGRYLNQKSGGDDYFNILKHNIVGSGLELFPNKKLNLDD